MCVETAVRVLISCELHMGRDVVDVLGVQYYGRVQLCPHHGSSTVS